VDFEDHREVKGERQGFQGGTEMARGKPPRKSLAAKIELARQGLENRTAQGRPLWPCVPGGLRASPGKPSSEAKNAAIGIMPESRWLQNGPQVVPRKTTTRCF
jgi:hypothetical protein